MNRRRTMGSGPQVQNLRDRWRAMLRRCNVREDKSYPRYGGRGIRVCERWNSFENFLADMGLPPTQAHQLDRIDPNDHYRPGNVRWATAREQGDNKRDTVRYYFRDKKLTLREWSAETGIAYHTLNKRLKILGWSVERALGTPKGGTEANQLQLAV